MSSAKGPSTSRRKASKGPSSTWTYLVNEDQFGWGVEMLKGTNVGFSAVAAALYGPLFVFALIAKRFRGRSKLESRPSESTRCSSELLRRLLMVDLESAPGRRSDTGVTAVGDG